MQKDLWYNGEVRRAESYHVPVMLRESVDALKVKSGGVYVDVTFGGGGHSREILSRLGDGRLYGFDQDGDAESNVPAGERRFTFVRSNFRYLSNWMRFYGETSIDGLLADLGVSSHHFDDEKRGFSFRFDSPLDMRMNRGTETTAADILNTYNEQQLTDIFHFYGELRQAGRLATAIVKQRTREPFATTRDLLRTAEPFLNRYSEKKDAARLFQALRMEVNKETDALREMLAAAAQLLVKGGRLVVITYHSVEDRIVKNFMKTGNAEGRMEKDFFGRVTVSLAPVDSKTETPSADERNYNPRSRSARLRIAEKI